MLHVDQKVHNKIMSSCSAQSASSKSSILDLNFHMTHSLRKTKKNRFDFGIYVCGFSRLHVFRFFSLPLAPLHRIFHNKMNIKNTFTENGCCSDNVTAHQHHQL